MSRRIEIELTSTQGDGSFTWRAVGAKQPKGVVAGDVLPNDAKVGDTFKVEVNQTIDGIEVQTVVQGRQRVEKAESIELLPTESDFKPVVETRAPGRRRDGDRKGKRGDRRRDRGDGSRPDSERRNRQRGPRHTPPPELPTRPKPKRLRPGKTHRTEVLAAIPAEQRPIAEVAVQGMSAVRQRLKAENEKAAAEGRPTMPEATVLKMAEDLLPKLRVADWRDRAEAAQQQIEHLDLRDLRSVVAAAADPVVARDESTRALATELSEALNTKQEAEMQLWFGDIDAALAVGRVIRALRLSAQPPKAGVPFPIDIAERLTLSTNAALTPAERPDRWVATLEAAAFSPIHAQVVPLGVPAQPGDELTATVHRLAPALPQIAAAFGVEVDPTAPFPKPLRPDYGKRRKDKAKKRADHSDSKEAGSTASTRNGRGAPQVPSGGGEPSDVSNAGIDRDGADPSSSEPGDETAATPPNVDSAAASEPEATDADPVIDIVDDTSTDERAASTEAEIVAEAEVVAEAEAITEAATEIESEGGTADDGDAVAVRTTEILEQESDATAPPAPDPAAGSPGDDVSVADEELPGPSD